MSHSETHPTEKTVPSKESLGQYVHDIYETEKEILTIRKSLSTNEQLNRNKQQELNQAKNQALQHYDKAKIAFEQQQTLVQNTQEQLENWESCSKLTPPKKKIVKEDTRFVLMKNLATVASILYVVVGLLLILYGGAMLSETNSQLITPGTLLIIVALFMLSAIILIPILIVTGIVLDKIRRKKYKKNVYPVECKNAEVKYQKDLQKYHEQRELERKNIAATLDTQKGVLDRLYNQMINEKKYVEMADYNINTYTENIKNYEDHVATFIIPKVEKLEFLRDKLYSFGFIPPDYRKILCVIEFDQMFRNDLVDNMRQAVEIYEERVFRRVVETNLEKIYNSLSSIDTKMNYVANRLESIRIDVNAMSYDMMELVSNSNQSLQMQDKTFEETRLNRYASEAVQRNTDTIADYVAKWNRYDHL